LLLGPQAYAARAVDVRSDMLIVEMDTALQTGATVSLIGDLEGAGLQMQLRSGAKVAHCRPCGPECFQVALSLAWSDLEMQRPSEGFPLQLDRRSIALSH
jgi:hypothetical protein